MWGLSVESVEIRLRDQGGQEIVWVLFSEPCRLVRNLEEAVQATQAIMDALWSDARDMGVPVGQRFKNVQKIGKRW